MGPRATSVLVAIALAACGGTPFTASTDDASVADDATTDAPSGDGSNGGDSAPSDGGVSDVRDSGTGADVRPSDAAVDAPPQYCHVLSDAGCPENTYCSSASCGAGQCVAKPTTENLTDTTPVCGCDGVTYFNEAVAFRNGMSVAATYSCSGTNTKFCNSDPNTTTFCPTGSTCYLGQQSANACGAFNGYCFVMPDQCPSTPKGRDCSNDLCTDQCSLVKDSKVWTNTCP